MRAGILGRVPPHQAAGLAYHLRPHRPQLAAGHPRQHLQPARTLEVVQAIERLGHRRAGDDHAMVGQEHDALRAEHARQAVALGIVDHQAVVGIVVGDVVVKAQRVLLDHLQPALLQQRERRGVGHVGMQHACGMRVRDMDARVDAERRLLVLAVAGQHAAFGIEREQVRRGDLAPMQAIGIEEKAPSIREHHAEMVADALVQLEAHREAESRGEIDARRLLNGGGLKLAQAPHAQIIGTRK